MIKQFTNHGFKDQYRTVELSGLDLFTSDDINGVGKSAVLEGFKLALLGEIPGKAKNVEDILLFTSQSVMKVEVEAETSLGIVTVERQFFRHAVNGEKRPIRINQATRKFEEGDQWIRDHLGAVSVSFDPYEFLNLSDGKKRQWILSHSPESQLVNRGSLYVALVARVMERHFGSGLVRTLLSGQGIPCMEELLFWRNGNFPGRLIKELTDAFRKQGDALFTEVKEVMDRAFSLWNDSRATEENIAEILMHLKSESQRLQTLARETMAQASGFENSFQDLKESETVVDNGLTDFELKEEIQIVRKNVEELETAIENLHMRIKEHRDQLTRKKRIEERIQCLQATVASLTENFSKDSTEHFKEEILSLQEKLSDTTSLQEKVDGLNEELCEYTEAYRQREIHVRTLSGELKMKQEQLAAIESSDFRCPVAGAIQCETDMKLYRALLAEQIESLRNKEKLEHDKLEKKKAGVYECRGQVKETQTELKNKARLNEALRKEINHRKERVFAEEKNLANARGMLKIHMRELESLISERENLGLVEDWTILEKEKQNLGSDKKKKTQYLAQLLRQQGKQDAVRQSMERKKKSKKELETVKLLSVLLGPQGIQGEFALRIAESLKQEVNEYLKLIHADYDFTIDLRKKKFSMGWYRHGRLIPFTTINSAHFILFIVPFLAAVVNRLARARERAGYPTLQALCIEAESLTPENLSMLLKGLAAMKQRGFLDNVLVAHYHSIRNPGKLFGFKEHILESGAEPRLEEAGSWSAGSANIHCEPSTIDC